MSNLVCLYCGTDKEGTVLSMQDGQDFCPSCRCRQFVTPEAFEESYAKYERLYGFCCTFKANTEIPSVRLVEREEKP